MYSILGKHQIVLLTVLPIVCACSTVHSPADSMVGSHRESIISTMGKPSSELSNQSETILVYHRGPHGKKTYFVHLNENGVMTSWSQVLNEKNFAKIAPKMTKDQVMLILGHPYIPAYKIARERGYVWSYRYLGQMCFWFQIEFDPQDTVRSAGYGKTPECRVGVAAPRP